ncbi:hypothetical protein GCM10010124_04230 [Pilimelia terevasa]|uniref:DUF4360 domain-containing protein n=1 Tax=Pilimelia terevasa TaxID=53372 RepID=A0A8J3FDZ1_9ACTN|nr:DUF4360 domain-containing protein [Pilimelia terevasa]GGK14783.1 hypothetical protein GCM10010124_04230 [Pilimelia terevasa]
MALPVLLIGAAPATAAGDLSVGLSGMAGSGCGKDDTRVVISPDGREVTTLFDRLRASRTPTSDAERTRDCKLALKVSYPKGNRLAVRGGHYRGWHALGPGAVATVKFSFRFSGDTEFTVAERTISGPDDGLWEVADSTGRPLLSPCGGDGATLMVDQALHLGGKNIQPSDIAITAEDRLYLSLQPCADSDG